MQPDTTSDWEAQTAPASAKFKMPVLESEVEVMVKKEEERRDKQEERGAMSVREAGRRGGEKVLEKRGREFYSEIGRKGGHARGREKGEERHAKESREAA